MEIVDEKELKRFAVIDMFDTILYDSDDVMECFDFDKMMGGYTRGVYDYQQNKYLDEVDILDITGCQLHSE